jgi:hypothetical protein
MNSNQNLLYYWKDIQPNLKDGKVGWLGALKPTKKRFSEFNASLSGSSNAWIIAFRWEATLDVAYPLAILKATEHPVVVINTDREYESLIYYDPRESFRLNQPTESNDLKKFYDLGQKIVSCFGSSGKSSRFNGANGVTLISEDVAAPLLNEAKRFYGQCLVDRIPTGSLLFAPISHQQSVPVAVDQDESNLNAGATDDSLKKQNTRTPLSPEADEAKRKKQAENGAIGEQLAMQYEIARLTELGCPNSNDCVRHVSLEDVGAGYDIQSNWNGQERCIEVKASELGVDYFFISSNELHRLGELKERGWIYRVDLSKKSSLMECIDPIPNAGTELNRTGVLEATQFKATILR